MPNIKPKPTPNKYIPKKSLSKHGREISKSFGSTNRNVEVDRRENLGSKKLSVIDKKSGKIIEMTNRAYKKAMRETLKNRKQRA